MRVCMKFQRQKRMPQRASLWTPRPKGPTAAAANLGGVVLPPSGLGASLGSWVLGRVAVWMFIAMTVAAGLASVRAATVTWAGATTGVQDWFVSGNWLPARVPEANDDVRIQGNVAGLQIVLNRSVTVRSLDNAAILRAVGTLGSFTVLEVSNGVTNRGEIRLESQRADRSSHLWVRPGGVLDNTGKLTAVALNGGQRFFTGTLVNRGSVHAEKGIDLEVNAVDAQLVQLAGVLRAEGSIRVNGGRVRFEGGVLLGDIRLFGPDLSVTEGMVTPSEVAVLGLGIRFRGNASPTFTVHVTTDLGNFSTLTAVNGAVNLGRIILDAGREDRESRIELGDNFRNAPSGVIEVVTGPGGARSLNGTLMNQGRVLCSHPGAGFTGIYQTDGGIVEGNVVFLNATVIPLRNPAQATELRLIGAQSVLKGDNPENLTLRIVSDLGNFSVLSFETNLVNHGTITLESLRADRSARLHVPSGSRLVNRGTIRAMGPEEGLRVIRGGIVNQGILEVTPGIDLNLENSESTISQQAGRIRILGTLNVLGGNLHLFGGEVLGIPRCFDVEHFAGASMTTPAFLDLFGLSSRLIANESPVVTYHLSSNLGNFTTLTWLSGAVNRGRLLQGAGRSDRGTRMVFTQFNTNLFNGTIEVVEDEGGTRELNGYLVNQGRLVCTNHPAVFRGTYHSSGGIIEGALRFENVTLVQEREAPRALDFHLFGPGSVLQGDNLQSHRLHVIADLGNFSTLTLSSNSVNRGLISLESERSDRVSFLNGLDGVIRNGVQGRIVADGTNGGGRELVGALQNLGRVRLENSLRIQTVGAAHRNSGVIQLGNFVLDIDGASFVNQESGRILGSGTLDVSGVNFTNAGGIYPGASPGRLSVIGNYTHAETGVLDVEIAGNQGPGTGHDLLEILSGRATLNGGRVSARLVDGFVPAANALFRVVTAQQGVEGRFNRLTTVQVHTNRYLEAAYSINAVDLQVRAGSISSQAPSIAVQPESIDVDPETGVEFWVAVDGTGPFTFQWRFKGTPIPGAVTDRLVLARAQEKDLGNYDVVVSNSQGSTTSQTARLGFKPKGGKTGESCNNCDFGDAPDTYGTSLAVDGARHPTQFPNAPYVTLGASVDKESDSLGNANSSLDDSIPAGGLDDENGVTFTAPVQAGRTNEVRVTVVKNGYEYAYLTGWLDMAGDGTFGAVDDLIIPGVEVRSGVNTFRFWIPSKSATVTTHARFRLIGVNAPMNPQRLAGPKGLAEDGEVEDHPVTITAGSGEPGGGTGGGTNRLDFGDAPNSYLTTLAVNGARHTSDILQTNQPSYVMLGALIDLETDGVPTAAATGDDIPTVIQADDEEGVQFLDPLYAGKSYRVQVVVRSQGYTNRFLNAWVDYGMDGTFTNASDKVISGMLLAEGTNVVTLVVPSGTPVGNTFSRFRVTGSNDPNSPLRVLEPFGAAGNGEVEDHGVSIMEPLLDFGDASENGGAIATTLAKNGPRHWIFGGVYLGKRVDGEQDGRPTAQARGDDTAGLDDEDGVVFSGPMSVGSVISMEVTASVAGKLEGWIDFNGNRSWADVGENVFQSVSLNAGVNSLAVIVPPNAVIGDVLARFRFSTQGNLGLLGEAPDGEVEDYKLTLEQSAQCDLSCNGSDFWLAFPGNQFPDPAYPLLAQLRVVGTPGNTVTVEIPGLGSNSVVVIGANGVANVVLPNDVDLGNLNDGVLNRGIHVTTGGKPVSVYAVSRVQYTSDGYLGLPVAALGTEYVVGAYPNLHVGIPELSGSQFVITATRPNTTVTITPAFETGVRVGKVPYTLVLTNAGDCYQLRNTEDAPADLTGTLIEADQPVAVFGGHQCTDINSSSLFFCDYLVEQIPPIHRLGTEFFAAPFATRSVGDTVRVVAARDLTTLSVNGSSVVLTNKGDVYSLFRTTPTWITSDKPVYAAQYASSSDLDGVTNADPFMVTLPGRSLFSTDHTFVTAGINFPEHYITILAPELTTSVTLDGVVTSPSFTSIGSSGFRYAHIKVTQGVHTLSATRAMGVLVYGWSEYSSYAWPACLYFGDTTPPVLSLATNRITRDLPANEISCVVTLPDLRAGVGVTDNCNLPLDVVITQTPPAGTSVGVGTHRVTFTARDAAGNQGTTSLEYVVINTRVGGGAVLDCPADITTRCEGPGGAVVNFAVSGTLNCEPARVEATPASGSVFPIGTTPVTVRLYQGNTVMAVCQFNVTVTCAKRLQLKLKSQQPGGGGVPTELVLDFDPGENIVEMADSIEGPWLPVPNATPGMIIKIEREKGRFYRIR